ncbi:MAG: chemotaxis protein CheW [Dehalococcoidia bacterium]
MVTVTEQTDIEQQLVVFDLAGQQYGVDISTVREIIRMTEITHVPDAPPSVEGVINLRGGVIPVVDLRKRFGLRVTRPTDQSRVLVVELGGDSVGVIVDAVAEVLRIPASSIEDTTSLVTTADSYYIDGIAKVDEDLLILLNLTKALSSEALADLAIEWAENPPDLFYADERDEESEAEEGEEAEDEAEAEDAEEEAEEPEAEDEPVEVAAEEELHEEPEEEEAEEAVEDDGLPLNIELLESSFAAVAPRGDELVEYFYETLCERYPAAVPLFENADMKAQQGELFAALTTVVASLRTPDKLVAHLQKLGRDYAAFGANPELYEAGGEVLLDSLAHIAGDAWSDEAHEAWIDAYGVISSVMIDAGNELQVEGEAA